MAHVSPEVAQAISRQKSRYGRYADTKQWDKFEHEIALPDAHYTFYGTDGELLTVGNKALAFETPKAVSAYFSKFFAELETLHNIGLGDFEQVAPDEVKAVFGFEDQLLSKSLGAWVEIRGGGFYYETWKLVDGQWYISELKMERTYQKETLLVKIALALGGLLGVSFWD
ncbi:hypothetical protein BGZ61DRAFT_461878 [Ilyonectria robusta]|uniref:uncharacterized protein n=1 Tax=Ilyonectria robusta TaxID=1079257 RepID=UPI001E8E90D3|nr:uncharacterized protein BGZ61DRAFT_461878 [Ilyonectria robusta]KAH8665560.1 hypothetical protein BGZ61DRAFT_461878 [Ilyonectria robusta]